MMKAKQRTTMVSCEGDSDFKQALSMIANLRGTTVAALVRDALDKEYGDELNKWAKFFRKERASKHEDEQEG